ncbi:MAG TPA: glycosyltransferase family 39 protein [Anaerolineales bacterium]|jgi:hypothetical protein
MKTLPFRIKSIQVETDLLFLTGSALMGGSLRANLLRVIRVLGLSSWWGERSDVLSQLLIFYGSLFLILAVISFSLNKSGEGLLAKVLQWMKNPAAGAKTDDKQPSGRVVNFNGWLAAAIATGAGIRGYFLSQPMRGDEAYTFLNFAHKGIISLFDYPVPNNHVLNTLLIKISTLAWGGSPAAIRLPAFLAGVASIPLTYLLARELSPRKYSGVLAAVAVAIFPYLILYSTNARGYALVTMLGLALAVAGLRYTTHPSVRGILGMAVLSALGMWAIPVMLFPIAGVFFWLAAVLWQEKQPLKMILFEFTIPFGGLSALFTLILYTPVMVVSNGIRAIIANKFVESQSWPEFITLFIPKIQVTLIEILRDIPVALTICGAMLVIAGLYLSLRERNWRTFLMLPGLVCGAVVLLAVQHTTPYARQWIYALPFIFMLGEHGFTSLAENLSPGWQTPARAVLVILGFIYSVKLASGNVITKYPDTSAFPEAPIAAQFLKSMLAKGDAVRVTNTADWSVYYYFWYYGIPYSPDEKQADAGKTFIIVKKSRYSLEDMTDKPAVKLLDFEDLALYQVTAP